MSPDWRNSTWANAEKTRIDCEINHPVFGWVQFTCDPTDTGANFDTKQLFDAIKAAGNISPYVTPFDQAPVQGAAE